MKHVIVLDTISDDGLQLLEQAEGITYEIRTGLAGLPLKEALDNADGAVCRSGVKITAESLENNKRLAAIVRAGVGTDNIDREAATRHGIIVMNTPTGNTTSTAEHTMALMLALSRNIPQAQQSLVEGKWDRKRFTGSQLAGKTLGIVGLGRIGQTVAKRAAAFGMRILALDPYLSSAQAEQLGIQTVADLDELLPQIDYLTVHTPKTIETTNLIGAEQIAKLKPGVRLINCARGGIYNEAALAQALDDDKIAGVALDVYETEPCTDSPLFQKDKVVCTPHLGASTREAQQQVALEAVSLLIDFLTTGNVKHAVNTVTLDPATLAKLGGFLNISYRLGNFLAQWHGGAIEKCQVDVKGALADEDARLFQAAVCAGLIDQTIAEEVNLINSTYLCAERGISIETRSRNASSTSFQSAIVVKVSGQGIEKSAGGTVFGSEMPRLVRLNEFRLESFLDGNLLVLEHFDKPGVIGRMGRMLGDVGINIFQMAVGRDRSVPGSPAIGVLNIDMMAPDETIEEIEKLDAIKTLKMIKLPEAGWNPAWLGGNKKVPAVTV